MAIAAIMFAGDGAQHAHLVRRQQAIGNGDTQHVGMALQIQAILQPQRTEFFLGQFVGQPTPDLVTVLDDAFLDDLMIILVIAIHDAPCGFGCYSWLQRQLGHHA